MFQVILGLRELQLNVDRPINKRVKCKVAIAIGTPMLGQLMSHDDEGQKNFTELAVFGKN